MAKLHTDFRYGTVPARPSQNSKKTTEKWETLKGWQAFVENDDTGIESWAKRRRQVDNRTTTSHHRNRQICEPFMCSFTPWCSEIEDVIAFKHESLCQVLNPHVKHNKDLNTDGKFAEGTNSKSDIDPDGDNKGNKDIHNSNACEQGNGHTGKHKNSNSSQTDRAQATNSTTSYDCKQTEKSAKPTGAVTEKNISGVSGTEPRDGSSAAARANRLISISRANSNKSNAENKSKQTAFEANEGLPVSHVDNGAIHQDEYEETITSIDPVNAHPEADPRYAKHNQNGIPTRRALTPRAIKLSYTQSNISLRNPYTALGERPLDDIAPMTNSFPRGVTFAFGAGEKVEMNGDASGHDPTSLQYLKDRMRETSGYCDSTTSHNGSTYTNQNGINHTFKGYKRTPVSPRDIPDNALTVTTLRGNKANGDTIDKTKSVVSQKQISLVLKKVSIQDNGKPDLNVKNTSTSNTALPPKPSARRHLNGLSKHPDLSVSHHMMPFGELLPVVDSNVKTHMVGRPNYAVSQHESEEDMYGLDKDSLVTGRDKLLSYEDSVFMMRDGVELINLKERQHTMLGPPAFKPPSNKTPLQRAKENTNKRIYGQLNAPGHISYTDMNKLKWPSSCGTLYTINKDTSSPDGETKSAPVTGRLSKRRKPHRSTSRPLGGHAAYHTDSTEQCKDNLLTRTKSSTPTQGSKQINLAQIREKLATKITDVIRCRTPGIEFYSEAKL